MGRGSTHGAGGHHAGLLLGGRWSGWHHALWLEGGALAPRLLGGRDPPVAVDTVLVGGRQAVRGALGSGGAV